MYNVKLKCNLQYNLIAVNHKILIVRTYTNNRQNSYFHVAAIHVDAKRLPAGYCPSPTTYTFALVLINS